MEINKIRKIRVCWEIFQMGHKIRTSENPYPYIILIYKKIEQGQPGLGMRKGKKKTEAAFKHFPYPKAGAVK